jgi:hypothetical protein
MARKKSSSSENKQEGPGLVFVEGGTLLWVKVQDDVMHDWNNTPTQQHVNLLHG